MSTGGAVEVAVDLPTADDTAALGRRLGAVLAPGDLVVLAGPLGAGKTCLAAGIGDGLGVEGPVTSPTFVIAREHPSRVDGRGVALVHVDAYRLGAVGTGATVAAPDGRAPLRSVSAPDGRAPLRSVSAPDGRAPLRSVSAELDDLDLDTDLTRAAVVVEWGEGVAEHLVTEHLLVRLDRRADDHRTATLTGPERLVDAAGR